MFSPGKFGFVLLIAALFLSTAAFAQTQEEKVAVLPETISTEQLQLLEQLQPKPVPAERRRVRRRLPRFVLELTPEQISYREAVQKLGVNQHQFVHCELISGKVRTGTIIEIDDHGFSLKDGIFDSRHIPYDDLKAAPRPVQAIGTRVTHGFEWVGVSLLVVVAIPFLPLFWDGC